tara:strand:- start:52 stop:846 length:795 start_codon:yes stop_codon:yes gene_type:complete
MFKKDRKDFESKWDDVRVFIEYGMLTEEKFFDKASDFALYKNTAGSYYTLSEFLDKIKDTQKNKDNKTIVLYTHDKNEQHSYVSAATNKGYEVLELSGPLVSHLISKLESTNTDIQFVRVDGDSIDKLVDKGDDAVSKLDEKQQKKVQEMIQSEVDKSIYSVQTQNMSSDDLPILITQSEFMRRMKEQQQLSGGGMQMFGDMPESYNVIVNTNHDLVSKIISEKNKKKRIALIKQIFDLALLSHGMLKGEKLTSFVERSVSLIK